MQTHQRAILLIVLFAQCSSEESPQNTTIQFAKQTKPVWEGVYTAADPSVVRDGDTLRMYYSSLLIDPNEELMIAGAKSVDGIHWIPAHNKSGDESVALDINPAQWDNYLEAVSIIKNENETWMYYCGYPLEAEVAGTIVAKGQIGLAKSTNNRTFTRASNAPILLLGDPNSKDANALFSPTIIKEGNLYYIFYVGYCIEECNPSFIGILGATSSDGQTWTKLPEPILTGADHDLGWAQVIKEPAIVKGPDNVFYLFISGDQFIGVARSNSILGPYEIYPEPILKIDYPWEKNAVIAPSVIIEHNKARLWYMGVVASGNAGDFAIGYAEADFPFDW